MPKIRGVKPEFWTDEDIVDLSIPARLLFIGLWSYACDNGHLQDKSKQIKMRLMPADDVNVAELLRELAAAGRIHRNEGWISVPNFVKHQKPDKRYFQTCEKPGCSRPDGDSQRETRGGHHEPTTSPRGGHGVGSMGPHVDGEVMVKGSDGDGDGDTSRELTLHEAPRADVDRICTHLVRRIEDNGGKSPAITAKWRDAARLMLDRDGRSEHEIHGAIDWCQDDEFWRANILSMPKLREKYDTLRLQAQRRQAPASRQAETDEWFERAMARAIAKDGGPA